MWISRQLSTIISTVAVVTQLSPLWPLTMAFGEQMPRDALYKDDLGLKDVIGRPAAFADFNSDKFTDILMLSEDQRTLTVYLWHTEERRFLPSAAAISIQAEDPTSFVIENVIPGDYNYDGALDVLVMGRETPKKSRDGELRMRIYLGNGQDRFVPDYIRVPSATAVQPIPFDFVGDMRVHLLGYPAEHPEQLSVWRNLPVPVNENATQLFEITTMPQADQFCRLAQPHSSGFVDLNGDCLADLFITCQPNDANSLPHYQIWLNQKGDGYQKAREGRLPAGTGPLTFADIDGDGTIDLIVPVCVEQRCSVHIVYNRQERLCQFTGQQQGCRRQTDLCRADANFTFDDITADGATEGHSIIPISDMLDKAELLLQDESFTGFLPIPVRAGDVNQDGYPDLLVVTRVAGRTQTHILISEPCKEPQCTLDQVKAGRRTFRALNHGVDVLHQLKDVQSATFFDFGEDGTMDVLAMTRATDSSGRAHGAFVPIQNNLFNDAFFLKTLMLNGVCPGHCSPSLGYPNERPYGVSYHGASFKYTVIDTKGRKHAKEVAQLSQSAYLPLQMPYCLFGLGRTNNYVEELFVGSTRHQTQHYRAWSGVIPNSQLIVVPNQSTDADTPAGWSRELFVSPGAYVPSVLLTLIAASLILTAVVVVLDWREKREDRREKRSISHVLNFDAL